MHLARRDTQRSKRSLDVAHQWDGPTQVDVAVADIRDEPFERHRVQLVVALALPTGGRSGQISRNVEPVLASEALAAHGARIDVVSGATYTSQAYARSLQAALDQAAVVTAAVKG